MNSQSSCEPRVKISTPGLPFEESDRAELEDLLGAGVLKPVHYNEHAKTRIFKSRLVREIKDKNTNAPREKSRLVVQGYGDEDKYEILTQSPTIQRASQRLLLALAPSCRNKAMTLALRDISQAYVQSKSELNRLILIHLPLELKEKYPEGTILQVIRPLHGISEAGVHWFATYQGHHLNNLNMETSSFDPCLLITKEGEGEKFGMTGLQTDDTLHLGMEGFMAREEEELQKAKFKAKPRKNLVDGTSGDFNGCHITIEKDAVTVVQKGQAEKLTLVDLNANDRAQQYVEQRARGAYIASICQPEAVFDYSVAAQIQQQQSDEDIKKLNQRLEWQINNKLRGLRFISLDLSKAKLMVFTDGSFANNRDLSSQIGYLIALVNEEGTDESGTDESFTIKGNIIHYSSVKCKRVTRSVLASEIYGFVNGFDLGYVIAHTLRKVTDRLSLPPIPLIVCTDSYSLYECLVKLGTTTEKRLMIDIMGLRQSYERREMEIRWINGMDNPADAMTKASPNTAMESLVSNNKLTVRLEGWVQR